METLVEALTQYVEENLVCRILQRHAPQIRAANTRAEQLVQQLNTLGPDTAGRLEQLRNELDSVNSCREQAFLLSGISIGLDLGRL